MRAPYADASRRLSAAACRWANLPPVDGFGDVLVEHAAGDLTLWLVSIIGRGWVGTVRRVDQ